MTYSFFRSPVNFIFGGFRDDMLTGSNARDYVFAFAGDDIIDSGAGADWVRAGRGDDIVRGGAGNDMLFGGRGTDTAVFAGNLADYTITQIGGRILVEGLDGRDTLRGFETLQFDDFTVFVDGRNNGPIAGDDSATIGEDEILTLIGADLLANDSDFDGDTLTITGVSPTSAAGAAVSLSGGVVSYDAGDLFNALGDGETTTDTLTYTVSDGRGGTATATVTVTVTGSNDAPMLTLTATATVAENSTDIVTTAQTSDAESDAVTLSLSGADAVFFEIDPATGDIRFKAAPDFETPADADADNTYDVTVTANDGNGGVTSADLSVSVTDVDETPDPDQLVITEIMQNPSAVSDTNGEYFEIFNAGSEPVDLNGYTISDNGADSHVIDNGGPLIVPAGGYIVLGRNGDSATNGGVPVDYVYSGVFLANGDDEIILTDTFGREIDRVEYDGGPAFPDPTGAAMELIDPSLDNNVGANWEEADTPYGDGDLGSPGQPNDFVPPFAGRINELHYDNAGADVGEFVEIRVDAGTNVSAAVVEFYNGSNGSLYNPTSLPDVPASSDGIYDYYVVEVSGIQNGAPDGLALINGGEVIEFLSYEGTFTAADGAAAGLTSTDINVAEAGSTPAGQSLQRNDDGTWRGPETETRGTANTPIVGGGDIVINELAASTTGTDWEFIELAGTAGASLDGKTLLQVDGGGVVTAVITFEGESIGDDGYFLVASPQAETVFSLSSDDIDLLMEDNTFTNSSSTFLLVEDLPDPDIGGFDLDADDDGVLDLPLSIVDSVALIEGDFGSPFAYSTNVVTDPSFFPAGVERLPDTSGSFEITSFSSSDGYTPGSENGGGGSTPTPVLISAVQGNGTASTLVGQQVIVEGIVTYTTRSGYYLQEESADEDGDAATSEAIFVFTGSNSSPGDGLVTVGQTVQAEGTVSEFGDQTQITTSTTTVTNAAISALPDAVTVMVSPDDNAASYESTEGMRVAVISGTADTLTVSTNFNLDRFGEIAVSAGIKTQATQLFDAQTEAAEVAAVIAANTNNTLIIDDGDFGSNPDEFAFLPNNSTGDNGNGIIDAADDFDQGGTLRLGTEITAPIVGIMAQAFGNYRVYASETLVIDDATNDGARPAAPEDVLGNLGAPKADGQIIVAGFNVENYFTTLGERGATSASDFERQTDNMVNAIQTSGSDVLALQELENNGFTDTAAIGVLVDALNTADPAANWAYVDPTGTGAPIGTDAITTGIIYNANEVTLVHADALVFNEASAADTFALAEVLNPFVPTSAQVGDFQRNRPAVTATFAENDTGETFTVVSVHNKSKGPSGLDSLVSNAESALSNGTVPADQIAAVQAAIDGLRADPNYDQGDGQGFWNQVRADASLELAEWLEDSYLPDATAADPRVGSETLVLGDFNAYAQEDPTQVFREFDGDDGDTTADYVDVIETFVPGGQADAFSFVFDGQQGTLDQGFASNSLADNITGATEWHINAQEPDLLSYDSAFTDAGFFSDDVFGASDHDPLIIGLDFNDDPLVIG
ncbi:VCBS repeat-containing protein [Cognatiyoonia koreensis]|uniref:VCBS repeat-containing protein n=1 Tax=Cognatiyoonia koreensis TaxID=364200 RepID=A0A1I0RS29_9RHOB|nr:ExeM/NucH family extracellular endonuclease [Cognatiyoonia koreensis]SEW44088.1 VCBS repeat-containing protein [Cognatiyoonia koreensis]